MMPLNKVGAAVVIMVLVTFFTRVFPFLFFTQKDPPPSVLFIGKYIPPVIISILIVYCLKDVNLIHGAHGLNELCAVAVVVILHLWRRNALISIFGGTILYMVLLQTGIFEFLLRVI